jgi:hypothetical protein
MSIKQLPLDGLTRRSMLQQSALGLGGIALSILQGEARELPTASPTRLQRATHARSVILLLQSGGVSQMDVLDPKPELTRRHGQTYSLKLEVQQPGSESNTLLATHKQFEPRGQCGMEISEVLPKLSEVADELCLVRSMFTEHNNHSEAQVMLLTGKIFEGRPTIGSWLSYGLGRENQNLPAYVVLREPGGDILKTLWSSGWMPAIHRGTEFSTEGSPILNLRSSRTQPEGSQANKLDLLKRLNRLHQLRYPDDRRLDSRIQNYELAARMQLEALEVSIQTEETRHIQQIYGLDNPATRSYGRSCLLARKLVERGVRFVQVMVPPDLTWDTHPNFDRAEKISAATDLPAAGLIRDLKQRGLLESTVVLWSGEFGRLPISQSVRGRDHNRHACSLFLAGGGFKRGYVHGATDEVGYRAVENRVSVSDLHATLLHQLGVDHDELTYRQAGRDETLTDAPVTGAQVIHAMLT